MLPKKYKNATFAVKILGVDITHWHPILRFFTLTGAVFFFYLIYGYLQELIFVLPGTKTYGWYLTFIQFIIYSFLSFNEMYFTTGIIRNIPLKIYLQLAFYTVATMGFSNSSIGYLNYPTQVIFKSCKLIPVLIGGFIIQGKHYNIFDIAAAALMSIGLVMFSLIDIKLSPIFNLRGYVFISLALIADAIIGNVQEKTMKKYNATNNEIVLYSYFIGSFYIFVSILMTGELFSAFQFYAKHPLQMYGLCFLLSVSGYIGINVVLTLVRLSGALVAVTVTTLRKTLTIILSFYFFSKPFSSGYVWSGLIILFAIYLNVYNKNRATFAKFFVSLWKIMTFKNFGEYKKMTVTV